MQDDWYDGVKVLKSADLSMKFVALFGCGDSESYCDTFCDGIGVLYEDQMCIRDSFIYNEKDWCFLWFQYRNLRRVG